MGWGKEEPSFPQPELASASQVLKRNLVSIAHVCVWCVSVYLHVPMFVDVRYLIQSLSILFTEVVSS